VKPSTLFLSLCLGLFTTAAWAALKPGDAAPDFTVDAALGGKEFKFSLAEALKKGPVVLYFYPKSFTSVCTVEAHEFAENIENFAAAAQASLAFRATRSRCSATFRPRSAATNSRWARTPAFRSVST
jgi:peroxiredoxin